MADTTKSEGDLSTKKESHMSSSLKGEMEFHIRKDDLAHKVEEGKRYWLCFPVKCTSTDDVQSRFAKLGLPEIQSDDEGGQDEAAEKLYGS